MADFHPTFFHGFFNTDPEATNVLNVQLLSTFGFFSSDVEPFKIANHVATAKDLLIEQFKDKENINKLVEVFALGLQEVEYTLFEMNTYRSVSSAAGVQLDNIGEIVGEDRLGRSDVDYRDAIRFKISINHSSGEPETIIAAATFITKASIVLFYELFPANCIVITNGTIPSDYKSQMKKIMPAGVGLEVGLIPTGRTPLTTTDQPPATPSFIGTWGERSYGDGGFVAELIVN